MGCITGIGRLILIILNLVFLVVGLALMAAGVFLKFYANKVMKPILGAVSASLDETTKDQFNIPNLEDVTELPFVGEIGVAFLIFGAFLFLLSFLACCGACYKWRPLLIGFVILMVILVICEAVVGGLFLAKDSIMHENIRDSVGDKVKNEFKADGDDVFSFAINILHYLLECCGIRGWEDFSGSKPPSCCLREIIDGDTATYGVRQAACVADPPTAPAADYNPKGCYTLLEDKVLSSLMVAAIILAAFLLLQVLEIIFACLIVKDVSDANTKISPR